MNKPLKEKYAAFGYWDPEFENEEDDTTEDDDFENEEEYWNYDEFA